MTVARATLAALVLLVSSGGMALAGDQYALVVTGASGGEQYAAKYDKWRAQFVEILRGRFGYPEDHLVVLAEQESGGVSRSTRENVQRALADLRRRVTKDDQLLVLLIGHGTSEGEDAKFNLVGPDLRASEWTELLNPIAGKVVFVDTTGGSFAFLKKLASRNRVVLIATDSAAQQFETVFAEHFIKAFDDPSADADRNGRVSIWEAFAYASAGVHQWFEQRGQLPTERALIDDTGDGIGREAQNPGLDGAVARVTYLDPEVVPGTTVDAALAALLKRRTELETALETLKARKESVPPDQYEAELERILVELARISRQIRSKS